MATAIVGLDIQAVTMPLGLVAGLAKLFQRTAGLSETASAAMLQALFGDEAPTFGQVRRLTLDELRDAFERANVLDDVPITALRELAELLPNVAPETPVCGKCGEVPLSNVGGKVSTLPVGAVCPFCAVGNLALIPMRLRKLAWTDGRLVEPQVTHDLRVRPGERLPLQDEDILEWIGGWMHFGLQLGLRESGLPLYGFLAYMRVYRQAFDRLEDAGDLLQHPEKFGLTDDRLMREAIEAAVGFLAEREVTNQPPLRPMPVRVRHARDEDCVEVAGQPYIIEGLIGRGERADVYRACWDHVPTQVAVIKVLRPTAEEGLEREVAVLTRLRDSDANGSHFFTRVVPQVVAAGECAFADGSRRPATVFRYKNLFDWTLADVLREYPEGVDAETATWMWNRVLLLLSWVHGSGIGHGNVRPEHVLIHPLNHGATLVGWSCGGRFDSAVTPDADIAASARCVIDVLGGDPANGNLPNSVPVPIADFLLACAGFSGRGPVRRGIGALETLEAFKRVTRSIFGPPKYHPFHLPRRP